MQNSNDNNNNINKDMNNTAANVDCNDAILSTDFYQLTMAAAYYYSSYHRSTKTRGIFEMFIRKLPRNRSYMVVAGLEHVIDFVLNLKFSDNQLSYLKSLDAMKEVGEGFFNYLRKLKFTGDIWAVPEGTILFPNEPIIRIEAPIIEAQIIETYILSMINFQSLIATKASRIVTSAKGKPVIEFGSRRAHGPEAAILAARAAYIGGCIGTSNTLAGYRFRIPVFGTMAHSFIMSFKKEEEGFQQFNNVFPSAFLLVDTYDTIGAVKRIIELGIKTNGIRIDSGDLHSLSIEVRNLLDQAEGGKYSNTKIMVSGDLNEYVINDLISKNAPIDVFAVGTELSTSRDDPAMNGVYKLVAVEVHQQLTSSSSCSLSSSLRSRRGIDNNYKDNNTIILYKLKTSPEKKTYPGPKQIYRILEKNSATSAYTIKQDIITLKDENNFADNAIPLLKKYIEKGNLICHPPSIKAIQNYHLDQLKIVPPFFKELGFVPKRFPVIYSGKLEAKVREFKPI
jgi:nicotinate phosphoribosyltransferase